MSEHRSGATDPGADGRGGVTYRGPLQGLADLSELMAGESMGSRRFLRGLAIGAMVGAAIAGSTIWNRRRRRKG
jgi:hypothetical protein